MDRSGSPTVRSWLCALTDAPSFVHLTVAAAPRLSVSMMVHEARLGSPVKSRNWPPSSVKFVSGRTVDPRNVHSTDIPNPVGTAPSFGSTFFATRRDARR